MIITIFNRLIEIAILSLMFIFPFSYNHLDAKWTILFGAIGGFFAISLILKKYINLEKPILLSAISIIFLLIFDFTEKVNFSQLYNLQNPLNWRIPISTIILSIATLAFLIKVLINKEVLFSLPEYLKYFLVAFTFLIMLLVVLFPIMKLNYNMNVGSNINLLNKVLKYVFVLMLILSYLNNESCFKRLNICLIGCISAGLALKLIL